MGSINLVCPECGGAIVHSCDANPGAIPDANAGANDAISSAGTIAHVVGSKALNPATKRPRTYNQGYDQGFLKFWEVYPLKRDKRKAQRAWRGAIRRANADAIFSGAIRYRDDPNRRDAFTKYAEGWLNGDCWEDEPLPVRLAPGVEPAAPNPRFWEEEVARLAAEIREAKG